MENVVRCEDCIYWMQNKNEYYNGDNNGVCRRHGIMTKHNWLCSDGREEPEEPEAVGASEVAP